MNRVSAPSTLSIDHLQVPLQTQSITASNCISRHFQFRPPSSHDHGLPVHLHSPRNTASKCIFEFTRSRPPSASPISLHYSLQVHLWVHSIMAPTGSPNSLHYTLQVRTIMASKFISILAQLRPPSTSLSSPDCGLQVHPYVPSMGVPKC